MDEEMATVLTAGTMVEADLAKATIEAADIQTFVMDEQAGSLPWQSMNAGIKIMVRQADRERAIEALAELPPAERVADPPGDEDDAEPDDA